MTHVSQTLKKIAETFLLEMRSTMILSSGEHKN